MWQRGKILFAQTCYADAMIYRRAFFTETLRNISVLTLILGGLLALVGMARLLGDHTNLPASATLGLVILQTLKVSPQLLTAGCFAALVMVFGRMCHTGEMTAWRIAGLTDRDWLSAVLLLALPLALTVGVLALFSVPWSLRYAEDYLRQVTATVKLEDAPPSLFGEVPARNMIYHLDEISPDRDQALGVFIHRSTDFHSVQIIRAAKAQTETDLVGLRSIQLETGQVHDLNFITGESSNTSFAQAQLRLGEQWQADKPRRRAMVLTELDSSPPEQTEFWWRLAFLPATLLLALLALPLGQARFGGGGGYLATLALLCYWLFYALAGLCKDYGIRGEIPALLAACAPLLLLLIPLAGYGLVCWRRHSWAQA